jgi:hypothetical protein
VKCEICGSVKGMDPYDTGFAMCIDCFEEHVRKLMANPIALKVAYSPLPHFKVDPANYRPFIFGSAAIEIPKYDHPCAMDWDAVFPRKRAR